MKLSALRVDLDKSVSIGCVEWTASRTELTASRGANARANARG